MTVPTEPVQPTATAPTTPEPPTPPANPPAPAVPPSHTPSAGDLITGLQNSIDGMTEGLINGMKEAFPALSQPPQPPSQAQAQQIDQAQGQNPGQQVVQAKKADGPKPTRLARAWFGK